jgi:hypothetical protein
MGRPPLEPRTRVRIAPPAPVPMLPLALDDLCVDVDLDLGAGITAPGLPAIDNVACFSCYRKRSEVNENG